MTLHQAPEEDATNSPLTTDLPDGGELERKGGQEDEADCKLQRMYVEKFYVI